MGPKKKVTFDDIAKYTHFSKTTISRYFNHPDSLTLENQKIISDALEKLNYQENKVARDHDRLGIKAGFDRGDPRRARHALQAADDDEPHDAFRGAGADSAAAFRGRTGPGKASGGEILSAQPGTAVDPHGGRGRGDCRTRAALAARVVAPSFRFETGTGGERGGGRRKTAPSRQAFRARA